jgi:hypothetical protein
MQVIPHRSEIDHHTIKLMIGVIALTLAPVTNLFADKSLESISASYYVPGWSQSIFIGFLFATAALLLAYNGASTKEMLSSKVAAAASLVVALFPCACNGHNELLPGAHGFAAAVMFLVLAYFCYSFYRRARLKGHAQAKARAFVYAACGSVIGLSIVVLAVDHFSHGGLRALDPRLTFHGEYSALVAFGVSWLTASRMLPVITAKNERLSILR